MGRSPGDLIEKVENLKHTEVAKLIKERMTEFEKVRKGDKLTIFSELCFCILTANFSAESGIRIQEIVGEGFVDLSLEDLSRKLKELGHRFPNARARYIVEARKYIDELYHMARNEKDAQRFREWLVKTFKGIGYKEASHFLRNIGFKDVAIIDYHIIDVLVRHGVIKRPRTLTRRRYFEIESILKEIAKQLNLELGELDLYLWYLETGKVLK